MRIKVERVCFPTDDEGGEPAVCTAKFTVDGQPGNQTFLNGRIVTLQAKQKDADGYRWEVVSSPANCEFGSSNRNDG